MLISEHEESSWNELGACILENQSLGVVDYLACLYIPAAAKHRIKCKKIMMFCIPSKVMLRIYCCISWWLYFDTVLKFEFLFWSPEIHQTNFFTFSFSYCLSSPTLFVFLCLSLSPHTNAYVYTYRAIN